MFIHQHQLRHLLRPEHYTSEAQYRAEREHVFRPAWHPVATAGDLGRPGDFLTLTLLGTPILLRNMDGQLRGFVNSCPHRHSLLTAAPRGNTPKLKCGYHGWEFRADGSTGRIPDAKVFRPWDRDNSRLAPVRVETCGELVFVNLLPDGPSLREFIGPLWGVWAAGYGGDYRHAATWEKEFPCNWKVVLENSLESYHIPEVHPKTFGDMPDEAVSWHELDPRFSTFKTVPDRNFAVRAEHWIARRLGAAPVNEYWHRVLHPHITGSMMPSFRMLQCVFPTGPRACVYRCIFFTLRGTTRGPLAWGLYQTLRAVALKIGKTVFVEDELVYGPAQRGLEASPHRGVIGTREERIYNFQKWVLDQCGADPGPDPAAAATGPAATTPRVPLGVAAEAACGGCG